MSDGYQLTIYANAKATRSALAEYAGGTWVRLDREPWPVLVRLAVQEGRLICTGLLMGEPDGSRQVTVRGLRDVPLAQALEEISSAATSSDSLDALVYGAIVELAGEAQVLATDRGPKGKDDAFYRRVWEAYTQALEAEPAAPVKYMREQGGIYGSDSTVRRWKREAERRFGPKAKKGQGR